MKILLYLGLNKGIGFGAIQKQYDKCYGFEANPESARKLKKRYENDKRIEIINAVVCDENTQQTFFITDNPAASSLGELTDFYRNNGPQNNIKTKEKITVDGIVLYDFLKDSGIEYIDTYISDIQGMDYCVLSSLKEYIDNKKIGSIQVEAECDYWEEEVHTNLPPNKESLFINLLETNYKLTKKQQGNFNPNDKKRWFFRDLFFNKKI